MAGLAVQFKSPPLPPNQQLVAADKWPIVGEKLPSPRSAPWSISVSGQVDRPLELTIDQIASLGLIEQVVDIHCVTRWSKPGVRFRGVPLERVLRLAEPRTLARFVSFLAQSARGHSTSLPLDEAVRLGTLLAVAADGWPLSVEHGGPVRIVVPDRYFYKSLKWLIGIELLAEDRLGYWEGQAGYHNGADPWLEQRYIAPALSRQAMLDALQRRDFRGRDLRSIAAGGYDLAGLEAVDALLRDANFRRCNLRQADFTGANCSNAHFQQADLREARFVRADVEGADFRGADLRGTDFRGASLVAATFGGNADSDAPVTTSDALIDATTRLDPSSLADLTADQAAFVQRRLVQQPNG